MIKHIVMWTLKPQANGSNSSTNAEIIKRQLESLNGMIDGLVKLEVGIDISNSAASADLVLYSELESAAALANYQQHPAHQEAVQFINAVTASRQVVDYDI